MVKLAIKGGKPIRSKNKKWPAWPVSDSRELKHLKEVLQSGVWSYNGPKETEFNRRFGKLVGSKYTMSVANGTVSLQMALEALDIGWGDEVIVPGMTWQATAAAVIDVNAVPVLVDVEPDTWCIDLKKVERAITPRTKAIMPVHLYGCIVDMDAIMAIARKRKLYVVEDCAHQHGAKWKKKGVGTIGHIGSFSLQLSKVLTAGEGGVITTQSYKLWEKLDALRNCGRRPVKKEKGSKGGGQYVSEGDLIQSGNYRMTEWQAAVLIEQVKRIPAQVRLRDSNAIYLNKRLAEIPGVMPMRRDKRITRASYFNFAFRYDTKKFKRVPVEGFRAALAKELGMPESGVAPCYEPLNDCSLYRPLTKKRYHISESHWKRINPARFKLPVCERAFKKESVCMHHSILLGTKRDMDDIADAVIKIRENINELK